MLELIINILDMVIVPLSLFFTVSLMILIERLIYNYKLSNNFSTEEEAVLKYFTSFTQSQFKPERKLFTPTPVPECFEALGFDKVPSNEELKNRYKDLARKHHPDVKGGNEEKFVKINKNYKEAIKYLEELK